MKKWLLGVMTVLMVFSLAACTPTAEKKKSETKAQAGSEAVVPQTTGGASDKVPDPNVKPVAVISIYHKGDGDSMVQDMDSLDTEGLDAQLLVDKLIEYKVLTEGTKVLSFDIKGESEDAVGTLNLNQAVSGESVSNTIFITEIGNTFTENFELSKLQLQVNGAAFKGAEDGLMYNPDFEAVE